MGANTYSVERGLAIQAHAFPSGPTPLRVRGFGKLKLAWISGDDMYAPGSQSRDFRGLPRIRQLSVSVLVEETTAMGGGIGRGSVPRENVLWTNVTSQRRRVEIDFI